ncbi:hypothetical protein AX17_004791 [Amanita inopinata Kibby_2008]|nr:hypothetical protein AX17_004791 [Amanita inopinata Kibby_2008]
MLTGPAALVTQRISRLPRLPALHRCTRSSHNHIRKDMPLPLQIHPELSTPPIAQSVRPLVTILQKEPILAIPVKAVEPIDIIEESKKLAAYTAVDRHVKPEHKVIGIGSGSTVPYVVDRIVQQGKELNEDRVFIPTGFQSKQLIVQAGLNLGDVDQYPTIDVTLDGADEVDLQLNCIKGGGACHLREKVLAEAARTFILVADHRKKVDYLGTNFTSGVPIEVVPFAYAKVLQNLHQVLGSPQATLRMAIKKAGPVVSDNGNFIIDAPFDHEKMKDPYRVMTQIKMLTGVVEVGVFCHMAKAAYFGNEDGSVTIRWDDGRIESVAPARTR